MYKYFEIELFLLRIKSSIYGNEFYLLVFFIVNLCILIYYLLYS